MVTPAEEELKLACLDACFCLIEMICHSLQLLIHWPGPADGSTDSSCTGDSASPKV